MRLPLVPSCLALLSLVTSAVAGLSSQELQALVRNGGKNKAIKLNDDNFQDILSGPREDHIVVLLTSDSPKINCVLCKEFAPEFELVANSWYEDHPHGLTQKELEDTDRDIPARNVVFFKSEFSESRNFFQIFQLNQIPKVFYFPPSNATGPNSFVNEVSEYQFYQGDHKHLVIDWLKSFTGHDYQIHIPPDYTKIATFAFFTFTFVLLIRKYYKQVGQVFASRLLWSGLTIIAVLLLTSGYMFNQIRGTPYLREQGGKVEYFATSQQSQYGVETQILSFVYGLLSLLVVILLKTLPTIKSDSINFVAVVVISAGIFVTYSALLSIFGLKGSGYPYRFINIF
ncbi:gamma subunit of Oligosaccharyltransferase [Suhomyces tanzawaensis NRRL Y-17324]|uniref:Gamma subunit of Oligosaccharyltransferase n=1 Tax=Suhomyces tanzawaensis NRRL Y-17324 TaxID=984487 RepID=A0A1E4SGX0_9ASCO|nr:gamma subunit of Oligosaccharyltransferase [Suhomyces tanzawaensis NRRL Y-17324]ODV78754.1 gamma subunit of Oligosaccharyltransferase [Suhomyces tanzawaensis NRRL Y-17324]